MPLSPVQSNSYANLEDALDEQARAEKIAKLEKERLRVRALLRYLQQHPHQQKPVVMAELRQQMETIHQKLQVH